ncbi:MAG: TIGR02281 family clan AA aspartic protease [Rubrivivax sp.]|nr:TIGR02281 family clan AA aspartic protease [Rubrivivax sp.]
MGNKALLVIDGQPRTLAVGETAQGVKLLRLTPDEATIEAGGRQSTLRAGGAQARVAAGGVTGGAREVVIPASSGGHFVVGGAINGRPVQMMVDTGATLVTLSADEAQRIGLDYQRGQRGMTQTANGPVPVWVVSLTSLRIGDVELANVRAAVVPAPMPGVLLGNSALSRFQMQRDNDVMRLTMR